MTPSRLAGDVVALRPPGLASAATVPSLDDVLRAAVRDVVRAELEGLADREAAPLPALLDSAGLARELSCSVVHVRALVKRGLPHVMVGDARRFELPQVLAWLRARGTK